MFGERITKRSCLLFSVPCGQIVPLKGLDKVLRHPIAEVYSMPSLYCAYAIPCAAASLNQCRACLWSCGTP